MRQSSIAWLRLPALGTQLAPRAFLAALLLIVLLVPARVALAQVTDAPLTLHPAPNLGEFIGRSLTRADVVPSGGRWLLTPKLESVHPGQ
ncbi:MAG TPA: hypothetical protein VGM29_12090, partial [Polyangiaceae bacterium]